MKSPSGSGSSPSPAAQSIAIVDDTQAVTRALTTLLKNQGFAPVAFNDGLSALAYAKENTPRAAIVDIHLPDINGLVLTQQLRDLLGAETPLIILSGDTSMETLNSLPHVGATYFFPKPVQSAQLIERLQEWVE